nr:putative disease resistance protein RGA3 isoform X2 [Coffea arabica]
MADALVGATIRITLEKAVGIASDQIGMVYGFKEDLVKFKASVEMILAVLADAEEEQPKQQAVQLWLKRLEGLAYEADNVLDELNYDVLRQQVETGKRNGNQLKGKVRSLFHSNSIGFRWKMGQKIRDLNKKLNIINEEANSFGLKSQLGGSGTKATLLPDISRTVMVNRETDSVVFPNIVGREHDKFKIVQKISSETSNVIYVLPITGMGGLGKTTLAQSIFNDQQIERHFDLKIWVCVSEDFEVTRIFRLILESLTRRKVDVASRDVIVQEIRKEIEGKRYLLVLDDLWNEIPLLWTDFYRSLTGISTTRGNWCLVTTRQLQVATVVATYPPYSLGKLSDDDCWTIIKDKMIGSGEVTEELQGQEKEITKWCQGLPLAAIVIGGLLRMRRKEEWLSIVNNGLLKFTGDDSSVMQILKLSFDHLPSPSIKKCFAYCSMFCKDFKIERRKLIQLWMAEGFLQSNLENEVMEEIGDKYFRVLVESSLLQEEISSDKQTFGRMHDLVHDLAQSISRCESIVLNSSGEITPRNSKVVSSSLRSLFPRSSIPEDLAPKLKNLRVLDLSSANIVELPTSIEQMSKLISLRHLCYYNNDRKVQMPLEMGRLTCLQTLDFFNVGEEKGRQIEELGCLRHLKGYLRIRNLELVEGKEAAERAKLFEKQNLSSLSLEWGCRGEDDGADINVLEGLQPHPNLQELEVENFTSNQFPLWLMNLSTSLDKLVCLRLINCRRCTELPALGQLPFLQSLAMIGLEKVTVIGHSFYGLCNPSGSRSSRSSSQLSRKVFPHLKCLYLYNMNNLVEWMEAEATEGEVLDVFPMLETLKIQNCYKLNRAPNYFPSLRQLVIENYRDGLYYQLKTPNKSHALVLKDILSKATTLSTLRIGGQAGLTSVSDVLAVHNSQNLKYLSLESCPHLLHLGDLHKLLSLEHLSVVRCPNLNAIDLIAPNDQQHLTSLRSLTIGQCNGLRGLPSEMVELNTSLRELRLYECHNLVWFPVDLQQMPSLSVLWLGNCPKLTTMPQGFGGLTSLRELWIGPFSDTSMENYGYDWLALCSFFPVRKLTLQGWPHSESLPNQLQNLFALIELHLFGFGIEALPEWLGNLVHLEELEVVNCAKLRTLPSMAAMRCLTKLSDLCIKHCPLLEELCTPQSGPDSEWSKINHIPHIFVGQMTVQYLPYHSWTSLLQQ